MNVYKLYKYGKLIAEGTIRQIATKVNCNGNGLRSAIRNTDTRYRKLVYVGREQVKSQNKHINDKKIYAMYKRG